ncbi:MAG: sigma-70 family RNA polymerase sigma factor [Dehalococcoidia bacterium]|nr:sigma-70 family RNA polymerase sigma factor [Dehalococcoidia bacterium]
MVEYTTNPCASQLSDVPLARYPEGGLTSIECALHRHEGLIHAVIRREGSGSLTYEEALQAGRIGLWRAILNYDPTRGAAFSTYAWVAIRRHIGRAAAQAAGDSRYQLVPYPHGLVEPSRRGLAEDLDESVEQASIREALLTLLSQLPDRLRLVVVARYGLDGHPPRTLRQLGAQLGLSHERVRQLQQDALAWLRHPAHSLPLRQLLDKNTTADYRQALALNAALRRARRRAR